MAFNPHHTTYFNFNSRYCPLFWVERSIRADIGHVTVISCSPYEREGGREGKRGEGRKGGGRKGQREMTVKLQ